MKSYFKEILLLLLLTALGVNCSSYHEKNPGDPSTVQAGTVSYAQVSSQVFQPRCAICHSLGGAGFNSSNYQNIVSQISQVQERAITKQSMPADSPLTPYETKVLQTWINEGMPQ